MNTNLLALLKKSYLFQEIEEKILQILSKDLVIVSLSKGETLFQQGDPSDALYIVIKGQLQVTLQKKDGHKMVLSEIGVGSVVGEMQLLIGGKRTASVKALGDTELFKWPKIAFEKLVNQFPNILQKIGEIIHQRLRHNQFQTILPNLFGQYDEEIAQHIETQIEWVQLRRGEILFKQGDHADSLFLVVSGRLRAIMENEEGYRQVIGEISRGESIGETALITGEHRTATIDALRDCELVKLSKETFEQFALQYPKLMLAISRIISHRQRKSLRSQPLSRTLVNIAVIPLTPKVPLTDFSQRLVSALSAFDSVLHLSSERVDNLMEMPKAAQLSKDNPHSIRLAIFLDELEVNHRFVIYESDLTTTSWTKWCLRRADCIILVADATTNVALGEVGTLLLDPNRQMTAVHQILVLLHPNGQQLPSGTQQWLTKMPQIETHHHIRWDTEADVKRLARFVSGRAIGLVLGGGGARGFTHFGVILALKEANVPIDMVGGTSIGAFTGAQYAANWNWETMRQYTQDSLVKKPFSGLTLPMISLIKGKSIEAKLNQGFDQIQIEDLWINFFCVSSNLSTGQMFIHKRDSLSKAIRASCALPGISEPVLKDGNLLVDGGLLNNIPCDIMRQFCNTVIVVDISGASNLTVNDEKWPSPWEVLWSRIWPFKETIQIPSILDVLMGATVISGSIDRANRVKNEADIYLNPPVKQFKLLQFSAFDELVEIGYQYTKEEIKNWKLMANDE